MTSITTKPKSSQPAAETAVHFFDNWFDPIETGVRERVREFIEVLIRNELDAVLARPRYGRQAKGKTDRNGAGGVAVQEIQVLPWGAGGHTELSYDIRRGVSAPPNPWL